MVEVAIATDRHPNAAMNRDKNGTSFMANPVYEALSLCVGYEISKNGI